LFVTSKTFVAVAAAFAFLCLNAPQARADDPSFLAIGGGYFDANKKSNTATEFHLEYHSDFKFLAFKPFGGVMGTTDKSYFAYAGIWLDIFWGNRVVTGFSVAPGYYHKGDGKDLGHKFEIRSQFEIAYRFDDRSRLGLSVSHMSNASVSDSNPGEETVALTYYYPLSKIFGK
jgi:hypothetical protein